MTGFSGEIGMGVFRATVISHGLKLYAKTSLHPNCAYTPKAMMKAAEEILGKKFKSRDYLIAAEELRIFAEENVPKARELGQITK